MDAKHTPGPWTVRDAAYGYDILVSDKPTERALWIASVTTGLVGRETPFYPPRGACEANARLIAAAPDMLAELRQCEVDLTEAAAIIRGSGFPGTGSLLEESVQRVRAAIAKAEGRS